MPQIDIHSTILTAVIIIGFAAILMLGFGINSLIKSRKIPFYGKRHARMMRGWRKIILAILFIPLAWAILTYSEPVVYQFVEPSPTVTQTPTITLTPTITMTLPYTMTPTITETPSVTNTPSMPDAIEEEFEGEVTPYPDTAFSPITFSQSIDDEWQAVDPAQEFENPVGRLYGTFSYNNMAIGSQWTAIWYWDDEIVHYQTRPWQDGTGGYGYTDWEPPSDQWRPGLYEVQIFVGSEWLVSGFFSVTGDPPTPTATNTPTSTPTPTATFRPTITRWPTHTIAPTVTLRPTWTQQPTEEP